MVLYYTLWIKCITRGLTLGELRRVVAVTRVIPPALSYTGGFHSARTAEYNMETSIIDLTCGVPYKAKLWIYI